MELMYLTSEGLDEFKLGFDSFKHHYQDSTNQWFIDYWGNKNQLRKSNIELPEINFHYADDITTQDRENVIAIHGALRTLSPAQASDERIWAALCHTVGWDFVKARRSEDIAKNDSQRLKTLFFYSSGIRRSCYLNALAKYWWAGNMVYSPETPGNPYAALDVLCNNSYFSSLVMYISSSNFSSNKDVLLGIVECFKKAQEAGINIKIDYWKEVMNYLNKYGSTIMLDCLSRDDITGICCQQLTKILS